MKSGFSFVNLCLATVLTLQLASETGHAATNVAAWGGNVALQINVPNNVTNAVAVAGGSDHSLALRPTGVVAGWGDNTNGEASAPSNLTNAAAIAAGDRFSLALKSNGVVVAWGIQTTVPAMATNVAAIAASFSNALALTADGTVFSWVSGPTPPSNATNIVAIAAGNNHSLALTGDGRVLAWGNNSSGQTNVPPGLTNVVALAGGKYHSMALTGNGTVVAWGDNTWTQTNVPAGLSNVVAIAAGGFHSLALKQDGTVAVWGDNTFNQTNVPPGLHNVAGISAGLYHNLAVIGNGSPVITVQPVSQYNPGAETATFWVMAAGLAPLSYQWQQDGTNIAGATNALLVLPNLPTSAAGVFSVTVSNSLGTVTSANVQLPPAWRRPLFLLQPQGQSVLCGDPAMFQVTAKGPAQFPLNYQWQFGGTNLPGATNPVLSLASATGDSAGNYTVVVSNVNGSVTSQVAVLTVAGQPPLITSPVIASGKQGKPFSYSIIGQHNPTSFLATGLPNGLNVNTTNGLISGTPLVNGPFNVTLSTANLCASAATNLTLTITSSVPIITSPLTASGEQAVFNYQIKATDTPTGFGAANLPYGLSVNPVTGVISGNALFAGNYTATITASNIWGVGSTNLQLFIASSAPVITSLLTASGQELAAFNYQIRATESPTSFGAQNLPPSLSMDPATGIISGYVLYAGNYAVTLTASNFWGVGTANLQLTISNAPVTGLAIVNLTTNYSSPYLVNFQFELLDNSDPTVGHSIVADPRLFTVTAFETTVEKTNTVSTNETSVILQGVRQGVAAKVLKANLVLDFSESVANATGGIDSNGIPVAVDTEVSAAQDIVNQLPGTSQFGVYEFHRDDEAPQQVQSLTTDKTLLNNGIAGIWTNYVQDFPAGSRCWDAVVAAIKSLGTNNADEVHSVIFCSDGDDTSSTNTFQNVITTASNANVHVYCVGFGDQIDTATLQSITAQTQGRYYEATNLAALAADFAQVGKDLSGQYFLRWATLKSFTNAFMPSFQITYQGFTAYSPTNPVDSYITNQPVLVNGVPLTNNGVAVTTNITIYTTNYVISPYLPSAHAGNVTVGSLRLVPNAVTQPSAITLRSTYVPRYIRQIRLHYMANWPCVVSLESTNAGEQLFGWSLTQTNDGAGGQWVLLTSSNPQSLETSIPFADFGPLLTFNFHDVLNPASVFSVFGVDNTIYTNTGNQSFTFENTGDFTTVYPVLPHGTPVPWLVQYGFANPGSWVGAEIIPDSNGRLFWQDYVAGLNPLLASSVFAVLNVSPSGSPGGYQITFTTVLNRTYRVETSTDLLTWQTLQDGIAGTGGNVTVSDNYIVPGTTQKYYRVAVRVF